jgi:hypothetical protein
VEGYRSPGGEVIFGEIGPESGSLSTFLTQLLFLENPKQAWRLGEMSPNNSKVLPELFLEQSARGAALVRDVFGNVFRPVTLNTAWPTTPVTSLAQAMYDSRDFAAMPILADALEEAGCNNPDILVHCRGDGPHVRGCWVVDLILGKK